MGVYIKGMEMPTKCEYCPCFYPEYNECNAVGGRWVDGKGTPPSGCPLVPVPPHGGLVDADDFKKSIYKYFDAFRGTEFNDLVKGLLFSAHILGDAPIVIQGEEVE